MAEIKKFLGLRNTVSPERFRLGELEIALDVELDDSGQLLSRLGQTVVNATSSHSLYSNAQLTLLMQGNVMKRVEADLSLTTVQTLTNDDPVSYDTVGNQTYWSNGTDKGCFVGLTPREWGITPPVGQPVAQATLGALPAGRYLYALTFLRSDGQESGTGVQGAVDVGANGGISFTGLEVSTNQEVYDKILYLSGTNGETLYRAAVLPNTAVAYTYSGDATDLKVALRTQHAGPPPAGNIVRYFNGIMYVVVGDVVYFSDPYNPDVFRMADRFLRFPGQVAVFECVKNGLYVATIDVEGDDPETAGKTYYLGGATPDDFDLSVVADHGAHANSAAKCKASLLTPPDATEAQRTGDAVVWSSRHGVYVGFNGGAVSNMTELRYSFPTAQRGAGVVRQHRGFVQYVNVLRGAGAANNQS